MKSKDKSSEQTFGHVNATNHIFEYQFLLNYLHNKWKPKIRTSEVSYVLKLTSTALIKSCKKCTLHIVFYLVCVLMD